MDAALPAAIGRTLATLAVAAAIAVLPVAHAEAQARTLNGAGATFPAPLYSKWSEEFLKATGIQVNYQSIGSGGGIKSIVDGTVDFGATDGPMTDEQLKSAKGTILHIPMVAGAVAVTYNLSGNPALNLSGDVLADIFLGRITRWNDPRLQAENPDVALPTEEIIVVHRSDGSGTTNIFTDYLSKVSADWKNSVGAGTSVNWPTGLGGKGNEGVAGEVKQNRNAIGYVELAYAIQNNLPVAAIKNRDGNYTAPSLETTTAAVAGSIVEMPDDFRILITNEPGPNTYPIAGFTWLLVYREQSDRDKGIALVRYLLWTQNEGQRYAPELLYAPIPEQLAPRIRATIETINYQGVPLYNQ